MGTNNLDVELINPSKGAKYSPNLYEWLTLRGYGYRKSTSTVLRSLKSHTYYIGRVDGMYLHGCRLWDVLCDGKKRKSVCVVCDGMEIVPDFWPNYVERGRCYIDEKHTMDFIGDDARWRVVGDTRECLWCGECTQALTMFKKVVRRYRWITVDGRQR